MVSEIERRRRIDSVLSPPIAKANKLASELKIRSDALKLKMAEAEAAVALSKSKMKRASAATKAKVRPTIGPLKVKFK